MKNIFFGEVFRRPAGARAAALSFAMIVLMSFGACSFAPATPAEQTTKGPTVILHSQKGDKDIAVEIADTPAEREVGLMHRKSLAGDSGMFFVFDEADTRNFWMKNTLIPLDMIFFGADYKVLNVAKRVPPCEADPCAVYSSMGPSRYVLEVNGGLSDEIGLKEGDKAELKI